MVACEVAQQSYGRNLGDDSNYTGSKVVSAMHFGFAGVMGFNCGVLGDQAWDLLHLKS